MPSPAMAPPTPPMTAPFKMLPPSLRSRSRSASPSLSRHAGLSIGAGGPGGGGTGMGGPGAACAGGAVRRCSYWGRKVDPPGAVPPGVSHGAIWSVLSGPPSRLRSTPWSAP
jgi:hypothetical protein